MICTSLQHKNLDALFEALETTEMAEIRLDRCPLSPDDIEGLFGSSDVPLVATCRIAEVLADLQRADGIPDTEKGRREQQIRAYDITERRLTKAVEAGAAYIDLEMEAPAPMSKRLRKAAQENGTIVIRSYHDFTGTPSREKLAETVSQCREFGAEVVKIVTTAQCEADVQTVLSLYEDFDRLIAFCMGEAGRQSRLDCLAKGAPYTYAALTEDEATAPGQWSTASMKKALYGNWKPIACDTPLQMPCSKSFAQRAILAAALAEGTSHLSGYSPCGDNESALAVARSLGATVLPVEDAAGTLTITGIGATAGSMDLKEVHVGESGLLTRLMIPIVAVLGKGNVRITGEKTLPGRPLKGAADMMASFGVLLSSDNARSNAFNDVFVPLTVKNNLVPGKAEISGKDGSQLISGLLTALPLTGKNSTLYVEDPKSIPYMFITVDVLGKFGIRIQSEMEGDDIFLQTQDWGHCSQITFKVKGNQQIKAADLAIEGDWSAAANFLVAGALFGSLDLDGLDTASLQADLSIMDILTEAGASLSRLDEEKTLHVQRAPLNAFHFDLNQCPDLFPIVAVLATFCQGESRLAGVNRLAGKESDRGKAVADMLTQMGVENHIEDDEMIICGRSLQQRLLTGALLRGGSYTSLHDHRMVMALKVAALGADSPITIDDEACVAKSFPSFHEIFNKIKH
ncbi:MAG: type I 3-dehydroquinate dehydratase [Bacteroidales bacterium]|nr:type I 3-dehydroquinate dehydratase [Bacteroidales bacterium]